MATQAQGSRRRHRRSRLDRRHPGEGAGRSRPEGRRARARRHAHARRTTIAVPNIRDELRYVVRHDLMQNTARDTLTVRNNPSQEALPMRRLGSFLPGEVVGGVGGALERPHLALDRHGVQGALHVRGALRQEVHSRRHDDPGLGHHLRRARALLRPVRIHRRRCPARPATSRAQIQAGGNPFEAPRAARLSAAAAHADPGERDVHRGGARTTATTRSRARPPTRRAPTPIRTARSSAPASIAATASASAARPTPKARRTSP